MKRYILSLCFSVTYLGCFDEDYNNDEDEDDEYMAQQNNNVNPRENRFVKRCDSLPKVVSPSEFLSFSCIINKILENQDSYDENKNLDTFCLQHKSFLETFAIIKFPGSTTLKTSLGNIKLGTDFKKIFTILSILRKNGANNIQINFFDLLKENSSDFKFYDSLKSFFCNDWIEKGYLNIFSDKLGLKVENDKFYFCSNVGEKIEINEEGLDFEIIAALIVYGILDVDKKDISFEGVSSSEERSVMMFHFSFDGKAFLPISIHYTSKKCPVFDFIILKQTDCFASIRDKNIIIDFPNVFTWKVPLVSKSTIALDQLNCFLKNKNVTCKQKIKLSIDQEIQENRNFRLFSKEKEIRSFNPFEQTGSRDLITFLDSPIFEKNKSSMDLRVTHTMYNDASFFVSDSMLGNKNVKSLLHCLVQHGYIKDPQNLLRPQISLKTEHK